MASCALRAALRARAEPGANAGRARCPGRTGLGAGRDRNRRRSRRSSASSRSRKFRHGWASVLPADPWRDGADAGRCEHRLRLVAGRRAPHQGRRPVPPHGGYCIAGARRGPGAGRITRLAAGAPGIAGRVAHADADLAGSEPRRRSDRTAAFAAGADAQITTRWPDRRTAAFSAARQ